MLLMSAYAYDNRVAKGTVFEYVGPDEQMRRFIWLGNRFIN